MTILPSEVKAALRELIAKDLSVAENYRHAYDDPKQWMEITSRSIIGNLQPEIERLVVERVDELVTQVLGYYGEDVFTPASRADYDRMNSMDKNLNTRLHCSGIRHGLHQLRRAARDLSAREDLKVIHVPALTQPKHKEQK